MDLNLIEVLDEQTVAQRDVQGIQEMQAMAQAKSNSKVKIMVAGVGGCGGNAVRNIQQSGLNGVQYLAINTDADALLQVPADIHIQLGDSGHGAGAVPSVARAYAEEKRAELESHFAPFDMIFVAAGLGKGTGSGATAEVLRAAKTAKSGNTLTVAVVTKPFSYEGIQYDQIADQAADEIEEVADATIIVMNSKLEEVYPNDLEDEWHQKADQILITAVGTITEVIQSVGHKNVDFNDVKKILQSNRGRAVMGTARATGETRAEMAAYCAMSSQLLEKNTLETFRAVLVNITAAKSSLRGRETAAVINTVRSMCHKDVLIINGVTHDESMGDELQVTLIASGLGRSEIKVAQSQANVQSLPEALLRTGTDDRVIFTPAYTPLQETASPTRQNESIPTLTEMLPLPGANTNSSQAIPANLLYDDTLTRPATNYGDFDVEALQRAAVQKELDSFNPKMPARADVTVISKPGFFKSTQFDAKKTHKPTLDVNALDVEVPTFLRMRHAD